MHAIARFLAMAAGGLLLTGAVATPVLAQSDEEAPMPGMTQMHDQMMGGDVADMNRMHDRMMAGDRRGMARAHDRFMVAMQAAVQRADQTPWRVRGERHARSPLLDCRAGLPARYGPDDVVHDVRRQTVRADGPGRRVSSAVCQCCRGRRASRRGRPVVRGTRRRLWPLRCRDASGRCEHGTPVTERVGVG